MPSHASSSRGFVLGGSSSHERLDDFRRRIGRRSRRRHSRRRSSSLGGSSSDMEDISEDPEDPPSWGPGALRPASSEPSLVNPQPFVHSGLPPLCPAAEAALLRTNQRRPLVVSSSGHPKAYSHDGVRPNLPVPFRAKFRTRGERRHNQEDDSWGADDGVSARDDDVSSSCESDDVDSEDSSCSEGS